MVAKIASIAIIGSVAQPVTPVVTEFFGISNVASAIVVSQSLSRATAAPLVYACKYVTDDEDAKGARSRTRKGEWVKLQPVLTLLRHSLQ